METTTRRIKGKENKEWGKKYIKEENKPIYLWRERWDDLWIFGCIAYSLLDYISFHFLLFLQSSLHFAYFSYFLVHSADFNITRDEESVGKDEQGRNSGIEMWCHFFLWGTHTCNIYFWLSLPLDTLSSCGYRIVSSVEKMMTFTR